MTTDQKEEIGQKLNFVLIEAQLAIANATAALLEGSYQKFTHPKFELGKNLAVAYAALDQHHRDWAGIFPRIQRLLNPPPEARQYRRWIDSRTLVNSLEAARQIVGELIMFLNESLGRNIASCPEQALTGTRKAIRLLSELAVYLEEVKEGISPREEVLPNNEVQPSN